MDSTNGIALNTLVDKFNAAHAGKIHVNAVYQGEYDDAITKYKASVQSNNTPSLMQIYDIGTQFMIDSQQVVPIQGFADRDRLRPGRSAGQHRRLLHGRREAVVDAAEQLGAVALLQQGRVPERPASTRTSRRRTWPRSAPTR